LSDTKDFQRVQRTGVIFFMVRTKRFQHIMDVLGARRITKPVSWLLLYLMPVAAAIAFYLFLTELGIYLSPRGHLVATNVRTINILANIGIPGINPYIPIVYGWIALVVALVVHEGAHGVISRSLNIPVKSSGLVFLLFVPIGAFVEPDDAAMRSAKARDSLRVLGGGPGVNLIVGAVSLLLLVGVVSTMVPVSNGVFIETVYANSPAASRGLQYGDFITAVNGAPITSPQAISNSSWYKPGNVVNMTILRSGKTIQLLNVKLNSSGYLIGIGEGDLGSIVSKYSSITLGGMVQYACIPTLPFCQSVVPFSDQLEGFYTSPLGAVLPAVANLLFWVYFLNFSLAIINALPIWPFDGGQAFQIGVKALAKDRLTESGVQNITIIATLAVAAILLVVILGPYVGIF